MTVQVLNTLTSQELPQSPPPPPIDTMEGFAQPPELKRYAMKRGAFYLGRIHEEHGVNFDAGIDDDRHLFFFAGSRSGKGVSYVTMNAALWPGPLFVIDPKGEAAGITALHCAATIWMRSRIAYMSYTISKTEFRKADHPISRFSSLWWMIYPYCCGGLVMLDRVFNAFKNRPQPDSNVARPARGPEWLKVSEKESGANEKQARETDNAIKFDPKRFH